MSIVANPEEYPPTISIVPGGPKRLSDFFSTPVGGLTDWEVLVYNREGTEVIGSIGRQIVKRCWIVLGAPVGQPVGPELAEAIAWANKNVSNPPPDESGTQTYST